MKKITKKLCSVICTLLAFSGNRGGALTKEILCNAGQWLACCGGCLEACGSCLTKELVYIPPQTPGQKAFTCAIGAATAGNVVDAAKRSYDVIKGTKNKPDTTDNKESTNYWPILEAIFGVSQFAYVFGHGTVFNIGCSVVEKNKVCKGICESGLITFIAGAASLSDAYFRFRGNNQNSRSPIQNKEEATQPNQTLSNPENPKDSSSDKK